MPISRSPIGNRFLHFILSWLIVSGLLLGSLEAASSYAGFYTGYVYISVSGSVSVPETAAGAAAFTVDGNGAITGSLNGTVDTSGTIAWATNPTGFTTGTISGAVLAAKTSKDGSGVTTTQRIAATNTAGGFGGGATVAQSLVWRRPFPTGANLRAVTFGGGKFVAVGPGGSVATSGDGTHWLAANANTPKELTGVAFGNGIYVAVGVASTVITSPDGLAWTARSTPASPFQNFIGVAFGNGVFVAANLVNEVFTSTDGIAWTKVVNASVGTSWNNLKYVGRQFVLVGQNNALGRISTSANGTTWNAEVKPDTAGAGISDVAFGNGKWIALAANGTKAVTFSNPTASDATVIAANGLGNAIGFVNGLFVSDTRFYSSDGLTWKRDSYPTAQVRAFANANGLLVAAGATLTTTSDGKVWTIQTQVLPLTTVNGVGLNGPVGGRIYDETSYINAQGQFHYLRLGVGGLIDERPTTTSTYTNVVSPTSSTLRDGIVSRNGSIVVGDDGTILRFGTGINAWTNVPSGTSAHLRSVAGPDDFHFVTVGTGGTVLRTGTSGQIWLAANAGTTSDLNRVAYFSGSGFNYYVAVGDSGVIRKSVDGTTWSTLNSGTTQRLVGIGNRTAGTIKLVAVADDSTVLVSDNHGTNWSALTVNAPFPIITADGATAYGVGGFQMAAPDNGTNWSYALPKVGSLLGIGHGNGRYVILGGQYRLYSTDLENWIPATVSYGHNSVVFGNGVLVSVGSGSNTEGRGYVSTSVDGNEWTDRITPTQIPLNAVTYAGSRFVAVGDGGTILSSTDGINWVNRTPARNASPLRGVAYGNGVFAAIGQGSILRYSSDGETWVSSGTSGATLNSVTFANGLFVAVGDNGAIRTSTNGIAWTARTSTPGINSTLQSVRYAGGRFIAVGNLDSSGDGAALVHSTDGTNWTKEVSNIAFALRASVVAAGNYVAVGDNGTVVSAPVQDSDSPLVIGQPLPVVQTVLSGANVILSVTARGAGLQFRWLKDGTPLSNGPGLSGSDTATLSLTDVDVLDPGRYQVSIWNNAGSTLSEAVALQVNGPPIVVVPPSSVTTGKAGSTNFTVVAVGPGPFSYQWRHNGENLVDGGRISGSKSSRLNLSNLAGTDEGSYDVVVSNAFGPSVPSTPAQLTVLRPPTILQPPLPLNLDEGQTISLSVQVDGSPTLAYLWKRNGITLINDSRISGATSATLTLNGARVSDAGSYTVTVTNAFSPPVVSPAVYVSVLGAGAFHPQFTFSGTGTIWDIAPSGDGRFLVAGDGTLTASGRTWSRLAKIDSNGVPTLTFATTNATRIANGTIRTLAVQADGQILAGGSFFQWGGNASYGYAVRLSADGILDTTFQPNPGLIVKKMLALPGGKTLLGRTGLGFATSRVNRYEASGALDGSFSEITNLNRELFGLAQQSDGTIWLSGVFGLKRATAAGSNPIAVTTFAPFPEMFQVYVGPDDRIYYSDNNGQYFGRLNPDGSRDTSFALTIEGHVNDMAFLPGGRAVIVGDFKTVNATTNAYIAIVENNGNLSTGFTSPYTWTAAGSLNSIEMLADGSALVGGTVQLTLPTIQFYLQRVQVAPRTPPEAGLTFAQWRIDNALPSGQDGPGDDPDGDGLSNLAEFALGTPPLKSQARGLPAGRITSEAGEEYPTISYIRRKNLTGATIVVEAFTAIPFGTGVPITQVGSPEDLGDGTERVTVRAQTSLRTLQQYFFRTRVTAP